MKTARSESGELLSRHPAREVEHVLLAGEDPHAHKEAVKKASRRISVAFAPKHFSIRGSLRNLSETKIHFGSPTK